MNITKRIISILLVILMIMPMFAESVAAIGIESLVSGSVYKIANDYVRFVYDADTGAFSVETKEGHPQKSFDNNIPLLYNESAARSNGTSYTTVRIDGKDYIFGQDYSYFGIETDLYTPVITNGGRMMSVSWGVKGYLVTQNVIISEIEDSDLAGNVGIGYTVVNMNDTPGEVGVRLLLDNALDSRVDAPYVINGEIFSPTIVETEYSDKAGNMPAQLSYVDSLANCKKMAYAMLKGWSGESDTTPDKVIVGHWANLANTRYDYVADVNCDFSNYSNAYRVPDTATAIYWSEEIVPAGSLRMMEMLYGIGNFTSDISDEHLGLSINVPSVKLDETGTGYQNNGEVELIVTVDNSVDGAVDIISAQVDIFLEEGLTFKDSGLSEARYTYGEILGDQILSMGITAGMVKTIKTTVVVAPEANLTSKNITVNVSATEYVSDTEWTQATYSTQNNVLVPGVDGMLPDVKMTSISPKMVYTEGEKNITVSGDMESLKALKASTGWELYLVKGLNKIRIDKSTIAFPNETYKTMTFSTDEVLSLGDYKIELHFTDKQLKDELTSKIIAAEVLTVCDDENFRSESYGLVAMVRFEENNYPTYDFVSFISEEELNQFEQGEITARGLKHDAIAFDDTSEIMAVVRGKIRVMKEDDRVFYQANTTDGDVTINNLLVYDGAEPLTMSIEGDWWSTQNDNIATIAGDGRLKVIGSITVWNNGWSLEGKDGEMHTLGGEDDEAFVLQLGVGGSIVQYIGGLLIDLKYGELTKDDDLYGISFGGKVTIPIKAKKQDDKKASSDKPSGDSNKPADGGNKPADGGNKPADGGNKPADGGNKPADGGNKPADSGNKPADSGNKVGFTKPSGDNPPQLKLSTSDSKAGQYINSLGTIEDEPDDGEISAEIEDIIFGHKSYNEETGEYETGFVGINTSFGVSLPADILGGVFKNKFGVEATVSLNTIDKEFGIDFGVDVKDAFECEINLAFKQITRKSVERYYPDVIKLYLGGDFMRIPFFGVPGTFVTGIGGGVSNLSDTLKDKEEGEEIAPLTIHVRLDLIFAELLCGQFEGEFCSEYVSITGELTLNNDDDGKILKVEAGVNVRWKPAVNISIYGNGSLLQGLMKGGISITVQKDYFYVYYYATFGVPESVPLIGGMELGGVEAAGSIDFIGANLKIIGIKFGFIYYWGGDFHIGQGIDLSGRGDAVKAIDTSYYDEDGNYVQCTALYGTNLRRLTSTKVESGRAGGLLIKKEFDPSNEDALLLEVPFDGVRLPAAEEIILITPSGRQIEMIPDDGEGGGNFLINDRGENEKKYVYITITDKELLEEGEWSLSIITDGVTVSDFEVNGVDDLPDIEGVTYDYSADEPYSLIVNYDISSESDVPGALDVYITENPDAMSDMRQNVASPDTGLISLGRITLEEMKDGSAVLDIPDTLTDGEYYVLCMLSQDVGGMSMVMSEDTFTFVNDILPDNIDGIEVTYGGDGDLRIEIERENEVDYNAYVIRILDENMELVKDAIFEEEVFDKIYNEELGEYENEVYYFGEHQGLGAGNTYYVAIDTVRYEGDKRYYSNDTVYSEGFLMPEKQTPVLLDVESNIDDNAALQGIDTFEATYTFDRDVYLFIVADTLTKSYSTECKKVHTVSVPLIEGDHVIDFYAVTPEYDTTDSTIHEEASFAFVVDTTAPLLKVGQTTSENVENPEEHTAVSMQNVLVSEDGTISFSGLTDPDAILTLDGTTDGIALEMNGSFTVNRQISADRSKTELELVAEDKAGNKTTLLIHLVAPSLFNFNSVKLMADKEIATIDDVKKITIPVGTTVNLSAFGIYDAKETELEGDDVSWKILYEQNIINFNEGVLTALVPGETAISVIYEIASFELDGKIEKSTLTDVIVIEVTERKIGVDGGEDDVSVDMVRTDYASYSKIALIIDKNDISSVTTVVEDKEVVFYHTGDNTYVASFETSVDEEAVLGALKIVQSSSENDKATELLRGDYDGNGLVNGTDMNLAIDMFHGTNDYGLGKDAFIRGDVNGDGIINIIDAQLMLIYRITE